MADWNDARLELLKKLWSDGLTASAIAAQLGGITRNAVIGKVHRLGLPRRKKTFSSSGVPMPRKKIPPVRRRDASGAEHPAGKQEVFTALRGPKISILDLTETTCHWPLGEPGKKSFGYCGVKTKDESPYCPYHTAVAHQPVPERQRRERTAAPSPAAAAA